MSATCETMEELVQAHVDGELEAAEAATLEGHLAGCAACREVREELVALGERLGAMFEAREQVPVQVVVPGVPAPGATPARPMTAQAPQMIGGYRLEQELARGGMGTVYRAVQVSMDRKVALKVLAPALAQDEEFVARFLREARVAATLSHANLVAIYDVGRDGDRLFYSMELVDGEDAEGAMKRLGGHLPARRAIEVGLGVARALEAARQAGIVHRDVKPANVMLTSAGGVKLTDLGLAKAVGGAPGDNGTLTLERKIIGSPNYMSPEQCGDIRAATHRSDVYSLGATLLHLLTGQVPFAGGSPVEVIARVLREPAPIPERLPGGVALDADLRRVLARALEKDPAARFATAGDLALELARWLEHGTLSAPASAAPPAPAAAPPAAAPSRRLAKPSARTSSDGARPRSSDSHRTSGRTARLGGSDAGRAQRRRAPFGMIAVAIAAALLGALAMSLFNQSQQTTPTPQVAPAPEQPGVESRTETPLVSNPTPATPRRVRQDPPSTPRTTPTQARDAEAEAALAALEAAVEAEPRPADAETFRRARDLALRLGATPSGERALALRDAAGERIQGRWAARAARARELEGGERWFEASEVYRGHVSETGDDVPTGLEAQLALRSLEAQVAVRLESDLARIDELLARGETAAVGGLLLEIRGYGGPAAAARAQVKLDAAGGLLAQQPGTSSEAPTPTASETPPPAPEPEALALVERETKGRELLARIRGMIEKGDLPGARAALEGARAELDALTALKREVDEVVASLDRRPDLGDGELLAAYFQGKVTLQDDERVQVAYDFDVEAEGSDWIAAAGAKDIGNRLVQRFLEGQPTTGPRGVAEPWSVHRKMLVGWGWERRGLQPAFRTDRPLSIEVEARGSQNTLIGLQTGDKTTLVGLGYMLQELPLANVGRGGEIERFVGRLNRSIENSRKRGPSAAIVREASAMSFEELDAQAHAARDKAEFTVELTPVEGGGHEVALKVGRRVAARAVLEDMPERVKVSLATLGVAVAYDRLVVTGALDPQVLEHLRKLAREVKQDPEALRRRVAEERERAAQPRPPEGGRGGEGGRGEGGGRGGEGGDRSGEGEGDADGGDAEGDGGRRGGGRRN